MPLMMLILKSSQRYDEIRSSTRNKRAHERYDLLVALDYDIKNMTRQCFMREISLEGAYIETEQEMELGQTVTLLLNSTRLKSNCSIQAIVVRKDGKGAGFHFQIKNTEQKQVIKAMIDSTLKWRQQQEQVGLAEATEL